MPEQPPDGYFEFIKQHLDNQSKREESMLTVARETRDAVNTLRMEMTEKLHTVEKCLLEKMDAVKTDVGVFRVKYAEEISAIKTRVTMICTVFGVLSGIFSGVATGLIVKWVSQ